MKKINVKWFDKDVREITVVDDWTFEQLIKRLIAENRLEGYSPNSLEVFLQEPGWDKKLKLSNLEGVVKEGDFVWVDFNQAIVDIVENIKPKSKIWQWTATGGLSSAIGYVGCIVVILLFLVACGVISLAVGQFYNWLTHLKYGWGKIIRCWSFGCHYVTPFFVL